MPLVGDTMEVVSDLRRQIEVMRVDARSKDDSIAKLQRDLESMTAALTAEQAKHAETMARNRELERELEQRTKLEQGLVKQLEDQDDKHDKEMIEVKNWYEGEIQRLLSVVETLSDAEERLCSQLADLEAEAIEENRYFNAETNSLSLSLARKDQELTSSQAELESLRQRKLSLKELESMDLAAQLSKSTHECDQMRLRTESLQEEIERLKTEASNLQQELALAKLISSWQQKEKKTIQEENIRVLQPQLCRSESLSLGTQPMTRYGGWQCGAV